MGRRPANESNANPQVQVQSGFDNINEVVDAAPTTTQPATPGEAPAEPRRRHRKANTTAATVVDDTPPEVRRFMREMLAEDIGGFGTVPYEVLAWYLDTPELALTDKEKQHWSDALATYAYLKSWDVKSPGAVLAAMIVMQVEFAIKRGVMYCKSKGIDIPELVMQWFGRDTPQITPGPLTEQ